MMRDHVNKDLILKYNKFYMIEQIKTFGLKLTMLLPIKKTKIHLVLFKH